MHSCLSMNLFATFAFLLPGHPTLSTTFDYLKQRKKTAEKIDTNAQWFHCSWSILLKRVNIRVRGFHLVFMGDGILASYVGIITDQYKDPYQFTSRMESKSIFCRAQLARSRAALKTPLCHGAVINSLCWGWKSHP